MSRVLLPTDFSENALNAAIHAVRLFGDEGNSFTTIHGYGLAASPEGEQLPVLDPVATLALEQTTAFSARVRHGAPGHKPLIDQLCGPGTAVDVINGLLIQGPAPDIIVMGTQGASGLQATLLGSHTADVIRRTQLPVLAIPEKAIYRIPKRIVLADDGGPVDKPMLKLLLDIARWSRSEVMIVGTMNQETTSETGSTASAYDLLLGGIPHTHQYLSGENLHTALNDLADQSDADLVALPHRPSGLFQHLFQNSVATTLVLHTHVPMLVLRPPGR